MGLFDGASELLFGKKKRPALATPENYEAPGTYKAPTFGGFGDSSDITAGLKTLFNSVAARYQAGPQGYQLPAGYEEAVVGSAQRGVAEDTQAASAAASEHLNGMNLLDSTAHGTALGDIAKTGQRNMADVRDSIAKERLGAYERAIDRYDAAGSQTVDIGQSLASLFNSQALAAYNINQGNTKDEYSFGVDNAQAEYQSRATNARDVYNAQVGDYEDEQSKKNAILTALTQLVGRSITAGGR